MPLCVCQNLGHVTRRRAYATSSKLAQTWRQVHLHDDKGGGTIKATGRLISGYYAWCTRCAARQRKPPPLATAQAPYTQPAWQQAAHLSLA